MISTDNCCSEFQEMNTFPENHWVMLKRSPGAASCIESECSSLESEDFDMSDEHQSWTSCLVFCWDMKLYHQPRVSPAFGGWLKNSVNHFLIVPSSFPTFTFRAAADFSRYKLWLPTDQFYLSCAVVIPLQYAGLALSFQ